MGHTLEQTLAFHCAPALMGLKPANLVCCDPARYPGMEEALAELEGALSVKGIHFRPVCRCENRVLLLVYRQSVLERHLRTPEIRAFLLAEGYPAEDPEAVLRFLEKRLDAARDFPHEVGIILGYPPEDVEGFRRDRGKNCKLNGYWKVYGDERRARELFTQFTQCRRTLCAMLEQGMTLPQLFHAA